MEDLSDMSLETIKEFCLYGGGLTVVLMTIIQITPIKINPWSWLGRCIGRAINGEVLEKLNALTNKVNELEAKDEEEWVTLSRTHILRFGDEILHGVKHSKEHFDQILVDIDRYIDYCDKHPGYKNEMANATIKLIRETYQKCMKQHDFL